MKVSIVHVDDMDELFCHYSSQQAPQPAFLELDLESGILQARYVPTIGTGRPMSVHDGRVRRFSIPTLTASAANQLMEDARRLAQRILAGSEIRWNGSNYIGILDQDASAASEALAELCSADNFSPCDLVEEWTAADWYSYQTREEIIDVLGLTADTTDERLAELATQEADQARDVDVPVHGYIVLTGVERFLSDLRASLTQ